MPSRASYILQGTIVTGLASVGAFYNWTKHCEVTDLDANFDPLRNSPFYRKYNPLNNFAKADVVTRRIPLHHLKPELVEDSRNGGSKLVEHFCGAIWSSAAYTPQRLIHGRNKPASSIPPPDPDAPISTSPILTQAASTSKSAWSSLTSFFTSSSSNPTTNTNALTTTQPQPASPPEDLWDQHSLATSTYPPNSSITNHFHVLSHTPTSILVRCGSSPLDTPHSPRSSDGLFEIAATTNFDKGYAEFTLKSIFYNGTEAARESTAGMGPWMWWAHKQYGKLWMESGVRQCRLSRWRSEEKQKEAWREKKRDEKKQT